MEIIANPQLDNKICPHFSVYICYKLFWMDMVLIVMLTDVLYV